MLEVSRLSRFYGDFKAVDDVSFNIEKGGVVGLLGHNGAGKTTIMKMISGFLEPNDGTVVLNGIDIADKPKEIQKTIGYLPESLPVYQEMIVADYLDYAADLKGISGEMKAAEIRRVVRETDITEKVLDPIVTLSRGYRQRVGVAQAILGNPGLLILDEPTNGLDPVQTDHMRNLIREIARHATVILSTHIMQEVEAICDRVLIVKAGKLVIDETLAALKIARQLDVATDLPEKAVRDLIGDLVAVSGLALLHSDDEDYHSFRIDLAEDASVPHTANLVARRLCEADAALYRLEPVKRNLESLFREGIEFERNRNREVSHAA